MSSTTEELCGLCNKAAPKYSCPRCNILYCSVACYKSQEHSQCSEPFYRECIMAEMASPSAEVVAGKSESMKRIYEMLMKMQSVESDASTFSDIDLTYKIREMEDLDEEEENQSNLDSDDDQGNNEDESNAAIDSLDLAERLQNVDLNDANQIWEKLTVAEQKDFEKLVQTGDISSIVPEYIPWWVVETPLMVEDVTETTQQDERMLLQLPAIHPNVKNFDEISKKAPDPCVRHNLINILAAYTFAARFFNGDHQSYPHESAQCLISICSNIKANWNYESESAALESVAMEARNEGLRFDEDDVQTMKSDVAKLLRPPKHALAGRSQGQKILEQNLFILAALSDLHRLLTTAKAHKDSPKQGKYHPGVFSKRFADHEVNHFGELKRTTLGTYLKKIEYFLAYSNKFLL